MSELEQIELEQDESDFSDLLAMQSVMFRLYRLTPKSDRVQRYLQRINKSNIRDLSYQEYDRFTQKMFSQWQSMPPDQLDNLCSVLRSMTELELSWENPVIAKFLEQDGITPDTLATLAAALQEEVALLKAHKQEVWQAIEEEVGNS